MLHAICGLSLLYGIYCNESFGIELLTRYKLGINGGLEGNSHVRALPRNRAVVFGCGERHKHPPHPWGTNFTINFPLHPPSHLYVVN